MQLLLLVLKSVKALKAREQEYAMVRLFRELRAPIPRGSQTSINARATIIPTTVETMLKVVGQYLVAKAIQAAPLLMDVLLQCGLGRQARQGFNAAVEDPEDAWNLCVLVNKHQSIRHVPVPQVHHAQANPLGKHALHLPENVVHFTSHTRAGLHTLVALTCVIETICLLNHVLVSREPHLW